LTSAGIATGVVIGYVVLVGAGPSVVRAALMAGALLVARLGGSTANAWAALVLAAVVMLIAAPPVLWDVGFQLSLLATAGLVWFGEPIERRLAAWPGPIREPVALTLAAQVTTLPVILVNFERLSLVAPLANVLVVPLVPLAMLGSAAAAVVGAVASVLPIPLLADALAWLCGGAAWLVLRLMVVAGTAAASVPLAAVDIAVPPPLAAAWYPLLALGLWAGRGRPIAVTPEVSSTGLRAYRSSGPPVPTGWLRRVARAVVLPRALVIGLVAVLALVTIAGRPDGRLHLTVLDIGQGDAILVEAPSGATMLVDGGPDPELTLRRLGETMPFFARRIDVLMLSHPHQDHVSGLVEVLARFEVGLVLHAGIPFANPTYTTFLADADAEPGARVALGRAGQTLQLDAQTSVEILYPSETDAAAPLPDGDINNGSIVAVVRYGAFEALLTGDAEAPIERLLVERGAIAPVDVLKVGHHGSHSSTTPEFLDAARPRVAIIPVGLDSEHGHPAPQTLETLAARPGIAVYRTDLDGNVEVTSDGSTFWVTARGRSTPPLPAATGSIGTWRSPTSRALASCSTSSTCPRASAATPRASDVWPWPPPAWWPRPGSRSTEVLSPRQRSSMTSTSRRSGAPAGSTGWWARGASPSSATASSRCRSPPIRRAAWSTTRASRVAGRRSSWPSRTGAWRRSS
jgi:competence protein ComEC